jgi:hypothetical protein
MRNNANASFIFFIVRLHYGGNHIKLVRFREQNKVFCAKKRANLQWILP